MKKILILILVILGMVWIYSNTSKETKSSMNTESRDFIVEDKNQIAYLTVKAKAYPMMHLKKVNDKHWILNQKYKADINVVNNMIGVLSKMQIKYLPSKKMNDNVIKNLDRVGIEIKAYDKEGDVLTDMIMGDNDNAEISTFCVRRGFDQAYAMHVAVTDGGLRNYFDQTQKNLRDKGIIDIQPSQINQLKVEYFKDKRNSFVINGEANKREVQPIDLFNRLESEVNQNTVEAYLKDYNWIPSEAIRTGEDNLDTILKYVPFARMTLELKNNSQKQFDFYPMLDVMDPLINTQTISDLDTIERHFVFTNEKEIFVVQQRMLEDFFKPLSYFYAQ